MLMSLVLSWRRHSPCRIVSMILVSVILAQGMPFKWYHGKTGVVWNVSKRAIGVEVFKRVSA